MLATHADQLESWLGLAEVERISRGMRDWYGPPIAVHGVPGNVWAHKGGDFRGPIQAGRSSTLLDYAVDRAKAVTRQWTRDQLRTLHMAGFSSLSDLILAATTGGRQELSFAKTFNAQNQFYTGSGWRATGMPGAGGVSSAAPGGRALTSATTGAFPYNNPTAGATLHFINSVYAHSTSGTMLLYDRLFDVIKTMNSTATEAVTGVPTRYQSTTVTAMDYAGGNFLFAEVGSTALPATAHNWTVCKYTNQAGTAGQTLPSFVGKASAIIDQIDHDVFTWYAPLAAGDTGVQALTQMQCSALVATGLINFVIGHPIAWLPAPTALLINVFDGIRGAFNLVRIFDNACLSFLNFTAASASAPGFTGTLTTVSK